MEERSFKGIIARFCYSLAWCLLLGLILGLLHRFDVPSIKQEISSIIGENSAPRTFNLIAVVSLFSLSLVIVFAGRTENHISRIRNILCYRSAEVALSLAAVFFGLITGFSIAVLEWPLLAATIFAFIFTVGAQISLLWLSFKGNGTNSELTARFGSLVLALISAGVVYFAYAS